MRSSYLVSVMSQSLLVGHVWGGRGRCGVSRGTGRGHSRRRGRETSQKRHRAQGNRSRRRARLARFGDAETCVRSKTCAPLSAAGDFYPSTAPETRGTRKRGIRHSSVGRTSARIGVRGWGGCASRASRSLVARGRISGAGEARVSGLGLAGHCGSRLEPKIFLITSSLPAWHRKPLPAASPDAARSVDFV